jgi:16S rRNA (guanine1207-N2)-methyltransferase
MAHADPVLDTLFLPFAEERLQWPDEDILFLRARAGEGSRPYAKRVLCQQTFKPDADALVSAGFSVMEPSTPLAPNQNRSVCVLAPRQREESRALLARAMAIAAPGGRVIACANNNEGARSMEDDLRVLSGDNVEVMSKNKGRVCWTQSLQSANAALIATWSELDAVRRVCDGRFLSRPGIFAWDRVDVASALLAEHLPTNLAGEAADLGCGFGFLAYELLNKCSKIKSIDLFEAEFRALELARLNLESSAGAVQQRFHWHDVTTGLPREYDVIVCNPPFHIQGRLDRPDIGRRFIAVAAQSLKAKGRLWLVANRHLPYEGELANNFQRVRVVAQAHGFKIIEAQRAA